jgi:hypothetical protein
METFQQHNDFIEVMPLWREYYLRPAFRSSDAFYESRHMKPCGKGTAGPDFRRARILVSAPFDASKTRHSDDRGTFTILVNAVGVVTGIPDWDQVTLRRIFDCAWIYGQITRCMKRHRCSLGTW